jgi:hypothetical protein
VGVQPGLASGHGDMYDVPEDLMHHVHMYTRGHTPKLNSVTTSHKPPLGHARVSPRGRSVEGHAGATGCGDVWAGSAG